MLCQEFSGNNYIDFENHIQDVHAVNKNQGFVISLFLLNEEELEEFSAKTKTKHDDFQYRGLLPNENIKYEDEDEINDVERFDEGRGECYS